MEKDDILNKSNTNQITIIYDFNKSKEFKIDNEYKQKAKKTVGETISKEKIFGEIFVKNNKNICKILINNEEGELCSYLDYYQLYLNEGKLEIRLIGINNIIDGSYMFSGCVSLFSLPDISKWDLTKVKNIRGMFFYCPSLTYIDDISKWNTSNIQDLCGVFDNCSSLKSLPDISQWNIENVKDINQFIL